MASDGFFASEDVVTLATLAYARTTLDEMRRSRHDHDKRRLDRYERAFHRVLQDVQESLDDVNRQTPVPRLATASLVRELEWVLEDSQVPGLQIALRSMNPLAPYEIEPASETREKARISLGSALGWAPDWHKVAKESINCARGPFKGNPWTVPLIIGGSLIAVIATAGAAAPLVAGAGAAGLAGGATFVSGLAALGGAGGMAGGIAVLAGGGALVGVGVANVGHALADQPSSIVEGSVIDLMATAHLSAVHNLPHPGKAEKAIITEALAAALRQRNELKLLSDDGARGVKEAQKRVDSLEKAKEWLAKKHLG